MRTAKIGLDLRLTTGRYGTTHQFVTVDLPTFYELFWAACAKTFKQKQKTPPQDLPLNQRRLWGKLQVFFRKRQDHRVGRSPQRLSLHLWPICSYETSALSI